MQMGGAGKEKGQPATFNCSVFPLPMIAQMGNPSSTTPAADLTTCKTLHAAISHLSTRHDYLTREGFRQFDI